MTHILQDIKPYSDLQNSLF